MEGKGRSDSEENKKEWIEKERLLSSVFPALICFDSSSIGTESEQHLHCIKRERQSTVLLLSL